MKLLSLVPVGHVEQSHLEILAEGLAPVLRAACAVHGEKLELESAYDALRGQYNSTSLLKKLRKLAATDTWRILGVSEADLYIPILTFVFGEAQLGPAGASAAVVSMHRLHQEFYGLPPDPAVLADRLLKESLHEIGHTLGLRHCTDYRCVMSSSPSVENIDLKGAHFCDSCVTLLL